MIGPSMPTSEHEFADRVAELVYSSVDDHYFAELWTGRWTTASGRPLLITAGRAKHASYVEALGHDISPRGWLGSLYADLSLAIYENICEPNPWKYEHGVVVIGGDEAGCLNDAWREDVALSAQWGGLTRRV
jgi:hypothetical protein